MATPCYNIIMRRIDLIVIHCSASNYPHQTRDWIRKIHMEENGWNDIGYHYFIRLNGLLEVGRPLSNIGAHVKGKNRHSLGICLAGLTNVPTDDQSQALSLLLRLLKLGFPKAKIVGHCDLDASKTCPNFDTTPYDKYFDTLL